MDIIGNMLGGIAFIIISFYITISSVFNRIDLVVQSNVDTYVKEFVDTSRSIGYVSPENYMEMADKIYATGNSYIIEIEHRSKVAFPEENTENEFLTGYNSYNRDDIVGYLFPEYGDNRNYIMKKGDFLRVNIKLAAPTTAQSLSSFITGRTYESIKSNYGGYIGNTK